MEVILKKDVENLGFKDDLLSVKNGYGRNYLIPRGFAVLATDSEKKMLQETLKQRAHKEAKLVEEAKATAEALNAAEVKIVAKVGKDGKLFGSVSNINLSETLSKMGHTIDKKFISINGGSVKKAGKYQAKVRLHREVNILLDFEVAGDVA